MLINLRRTRVEGRVVSSYLPSRAPTRVISRHTYIVSFGPPAPFGAPQRLESGAAKGGRETKAGFQGFGATRRRRRSPGGPFNVKGVSVPASRTTRRGPKRAFVPASSALLYRAAPRATARRKHASSLRLFYFPLFFCRHSYTRVFWGCFGAKFAPVFSPLPAPLLAGKRKGAPLRFQLVL